MKRYDRELTAKELAALSDDEIDFSDIPELDDTFWKNAKVFEPRDKKPISLRVDEDVLAYFQKDGPGYQTRMNAVLKAYVEAMKAKINPAPAK